MSPSLQEVNKPFSNWVKIYLLNSWMVCCYFISSDFICHCRSEYVFSFDNAFELHNDIDVLKKMGLDCGIHSGSCSAENLKHAKSMLPKAFGDILDGTSILMRSA